MFLIYMIHMLTFVSVFTANQLKHISKELILFAGNYLLGYNSAAFQATNKWVCYIWRRKHKKWLYNIWIHTITGM